MIKKYETYTRKILFKLKFYANFTLIDGESGVGKTILFQALKEDGAGGKINSLCLNYCDKKSGVSDTMLETARNKIIVIDNSDVILNDTQRHKISIDKNNQYIVFAHSIQGFHTTAKNIAELVLENNIGRLEYPFL